MRVLSVGGGSGGHVTPVLAVINELSKLDPELVVEFVCDKGFEAQSRGKMKLAAVDVAVTVISAGKLRRYYGESFATRFFDYKTNFKNTVDVFKIMVGFVQSIRLIRRFKPDVVFAKGGFVCLPLGFAAKLLSVPIVIHDSDTRPGLTNKLLSKYAAGIATGSPLENYPYPLHKSVYTGVPIDSRFHPMSPNDQRKAKQRIGIEDVQKPLVVVTGGGLGARSINRGIVQAAPSLLKNGYEIYHVTGVKQYGEVKSGALDAPGYHIIDFVYEDIVDVLGAADIVISRASATFLQELAACKKSSIIVPAAHLSDQVKNAEVYRSAGAVMVLEDDKVVQPGLLLDAIETLHHDKKVAQDMATTFHSFAKPDAARDVAKLIIQTAEAN